MSTTHHEPAAPPATQHASSERPFKPPGWLWARFGDVGWWVLPAYRNALLGPRGLRLDEWRRDGRLSTVKTGPHRVVYRVDLPGGAIYVKHFLVPGYRELFRQWFRRGKGRNEGRRASSLASLGVPTIRPVALGEQRKRVFLFENYLVSPAIPDSVPLDRFLEREIGTLPPARATLVRRRLAVALGELTGRLHEAGLLHADFHPGNLLVRIDDQDQPSLAMIDLDALRKRRRISWNAAQANLALLNHYFWIRSSRPDRLRFARAYLAARKSAPPSPQRFILGIEEATRTWAERLWRRWGRRCCGTNKYFHTFRSTAGWAVASRDLAPPLATQLLADPEAPFRQTTTHVIKDSRTALVAEATVTVAGRSTRVIYKRFNRKKWLEPLYTLFRHSRAWRAWQAGQHLASRGIPTPKNLLVVGRTAPPPRKFGVWLAPVVTYLMTLKAEPSMTLADYLLEVLPTRPPEVQQQVRRRLTLALARLVRLMHERSLSDRDLKAANILIEGDPEASEPQLSLIDLVGVQLQHPLPWHRRVQNLARLFLSVQSLPGFNRTDAMRFLHAYLPWGMVGPGHWKEVWRAVSLRSREKVEQNLQRGRVIS